MDALKFDYGVVMYKIDICFKVDKLNVESQVPV